VGDVDEQLTEASGPISRGRGLLTAGGVALVVASALLGSNMFGLRDSLLGSATPEPAPSVASRVAGEAPATTPERTRLRSQPWWQEVTVLEGAGPTTAAPFTIVDSAIQWRVKGTCQSGRLVVQAPQRPKPLIDAACEGGASGFATKTGEVTMKVTADGPWKLQVEQQVEVPLVEPPLPTMMAPGAAAVSKGSFYKIDRSATGTATIYRLADGSHAIRLDDFFVSPNSELEVRLSTLKAPQNNKEYLAAPSELITKLDVTTGSLNFAIPPNINPADYGSVVIWCQAVESAYGAATLGPVQ